MDWKAVGKQLINIGVPILGTALAGPPGGLAAKAAISLIGAKVGIEEENITPTTVAELIANPDQVVKLKEIESNHAIRLEELIVEDRKSARQREVEIVKATGSRDINLYVLAYLFIAGFFVSIGAMVWVLISGHWPENIPQAVILLIGGLFGTLTSGVSAVLQYFFGSSKSSTDKTKLMAGK